MWCFTAFMGILSWMEGTWFDDLYIPRNFINSLRPENRPSLWYYLGPEFDPRPYDNGLNNRPIISVLTIDLPEPIEHKGKTYRHYLPLSIVTFIEQTGGRVIPVLRGRGPGYYRKLYNSTNGFITLGTMDSFSLGKFDIYRMSIATSESSCNVWTSDTFIMVLLFYQNTRR